MALESMAVEVAAASDDAISAVGPWAALGRPFIRGDWDVRSQRAITGMACMRTHLTRWHRDQPGD